MADGTYSVTDSLFYTGLSPYGILLPVTSCCSIGFYELLYVYILIENLQYVADRDSSLSISQDVWLK
jgi:hypothetical protein